MRAQLFDSMQEGMAITHNIIRYYKYIVKL